MMDVRGALRGVYMPSGALSKTAIWLGEVDFARSVVAEEWSEMMMS
jgi:hypothetical protein